MKSYLILITLLLGCTSNRESLDPSQITWDFHQSNSNPSEKKVFLNVNHKSYEIISPTTAHYRQLDRLEFEDYNIPTNAITAAAPFYAEPGSLLYVVQQSNQLKVFRRKMDKNENNHFIIEKIATISF